MMVAQHEHSDLRIVSVTQADLDAIVELERACYPSPWSRRMFEQEMLRTDGMRLAAWCGDELAGYCITARYGDVWHIMNIAVHPAWRRRGIARMLLEQFFMFVPRAELQSYTLEVRMSNAAAISLYEGFGFVASGVRPRYYSDNREDALIMWRLAKGQSLP